MSDTTMHGFTTVELEALLRKARNDALEEAAKVCDARFMGDLNREDMEARRCAAAIRAMKEKRDETK